MKPPFNIDILKQIQKVEPPPFLFTRIEAKIHYQDQKTNRWFWATSVALILVMVCNILVFTLNSTKKQSVESTFLKETPLHYSQQLYEN